MNACGNVVERDESKYMGIVDHILSKLPSHNTLQVSFLQKYFVDILKMHMNVLSNVLFLKGRVEANHWERRSVLWSIATKTACLDFPRLSEQDLQKITLGIYQVNLADQYNKEHENDESDYDFFFHKEESCLIRVKLRSRFCRSSSHLVWIEYNARNEGWRSVLDWYCRYLQE